ncbi:hypothetical protein GCM10010174_70310 [Kutzneria viridogrisea]
MADTPAAPIAALALLVYLVGMLLVALARWAWQTVAIQDLVLRLTGESSYVPTSWSSRRPLRRGHGPQPARHRRCGGFPASARSHGTRRTPLAGAQSPAGPSPVPVGPSSVPTTPVRGTEAATLRTSARGGTQPAPAARDHMSTVPPECPSRGAS